MPVVESPFWDSWPGREGALPPKGVFVLLKIDPVASVANLDDEEATRAAAALDRHEWALGVVTGTGGGSFIDPMAKAVLSLQIQLIGQGPPDDKPIASIPISPSPQLYDRSPLELNAPLPWSDLYVHTKYSSSVIISRIHYGATKFETELTNAEREDLFKRAHLDRYNWRNLPPVTPADPVDDVVAPTEPSDSSEQTGDSDIDDESSSDEDSLYAQEMEDLGTKVLRQRIYGEISLDPSMCPGSLGVPCQLTEPVRRIRELWSAWEERRTTQILAKRPQTTAWAQGVTDAQSFNDPGFEPDNVRPPETPLDDEIMPEDAIDDRIERDRLARAAKRAAPPSPQAGDVPMPNVIPSPPLSSTVAPFPGSATSQIQVASYGHTSVGDDKDAPSTLVSRAPERATNVGDAESQAVPPRALEAKGPACELRGEGSRSAETPSFVGAKLSGLIKGVHSASSTIAGFARKIMLAKDRSRKADSPRSVGQEKCCARSSTPTP